MLEKHMSDDPKSGDWVTSGPQRNHAFDTRSDAGPDVRAPGVARSVQWGLAGLLLGVPLLVAAQGQLLLNRNFWTLGPHGMRLPIAFACTLICFAMLTTLGVIGVICGLRGWLLAASERQPIALGMAGTLLSAVSLIIWVGIFIDLFAFFFEHMH
jgi:hypothetical protein